jgi:hypothetical protein
MRTLRAKRTAGCGAGDPKRWLSATVLFAALISPDRASALDYDVDGFLRFDYHLHDNLPLSPAGLASQEEYVDMRLSVSPRLHLGEELLIAARIDALDGVIAGDGRDELDVLAGLDPVGGTRDAGGDDLDSIELDRAWLEYTPSFGLFRVGRQSADWGLGILANGGGDALEWGLAGNGPGRGDTVDRASFVTDLFQWLGFAEDHLLVGGAYDRVHEGDPLLRADDVSQLVASALYTNGTIRPRELGTREAGLYGIYVMNHDVHSEVGVLDFYGRLELGPERMNLFGEIEGAWTLGSADRRGFVSDALLDRATQIASDSFSSSLEATGLEPDAAAARGASIASHGSASATERAAITPGLTKTFTASGWSEESARATSERIAAEGVDGIAQDEITAQALGGVMRSGMVVGPARLNFEVGGSRALAGDDVTPPMIGPFTGGKSELVGETIGSVLEQRALEAALTGSRASLFSFDREFDPALILFEEVGPVGAEGDPTVANAFYVKLAASLSPLPDLDVSGLVLYGQLARKVERFTVMCGPPADCRENLSATAMPAGAADELGVEVDLGVTYHVIEHLTAELRGGYLFSGHAFGPDAQDVKAIRVQIGVEW